MVYNFLHTNSLWSALNKSIYLPRLTYFSHKPVKLLKDILIEINIFICFMNLIHYFPKVLWAVLLSLSLSPINYFEKTRWHKRDWERIHFPSPGSSPAELSRHQTSCVVQMNGEERWWGKEGEDGQCKCSLASHSVQFRFCESSAKLKSQSFYVAFSNPGTPSMTTNLLQVIKPCWVFPTSTNAALVQHWCSYT